MAVCFTTVQNIRNKYLYFFRFCKNFRVSSSFRSHVYQLTLIVTGAFYDVLNEIGH